MRPEPALGFTPQCMSGYLGSVHKTPALGNTGAGLLFSAFNWGSAPDSVSLIHSGAGVLGGNKVVGKPLEPACAKRECATVRVGTGIPYVWPAGLGAPDNHLATARLTHAAAYL